MGVILLATNSTGSQSHSVIKAAARAKFHAVVAVSQIQLRFILNKAGSNRIRVSPVRSFSAAQIARESKLGDVHSPSSASLQLTRTLV